MMCPNTTQFYFITFLKQFCVKIVKNNAKILTLYIVLIYRLTIQKFLIYVITSI
jgi:hypothetical protein